MVGGCFGSGAESERDSLGWLRDVPVWKADVGVLDEPWRGAAPHRAMLVVMGEGNVVLQELLDAGRARPPWAAAQVLGTAVHAVARRAGGYPRTLLVREWATAARLAAELGPHGVEVRVSPSLREVRFTIRHLATLLDIPDMAEDLLPLEDWDEDEMDPPLGQMLFPAAARFWRARPWERLPDGEAFLVLWRGRKSILSITRPDGHGLVATLFTRVRDYYEDAPFGMPEHTILGLRFTAGWAVPRVLRRQIRARGWEVADPGAYPLLLGAGPAFHEGLGIGDALHLAAVLQAMAAWTETHRAAPSTLPFHHADTGVEVRPELDAEAVPWPSMRRARAVCAQGRRPAQAHQVPHPASPPPTDKEARRVTTFAAHLRAIGTRAALTTRYARAAAEWARFVDNQAGLSLAGVTEYDLRLFLYGWYPLHARGSEDEAERLPASLRRYFAWLAEHQGISYPWAPAVLRERDAYRERLETVPLGMLEAGRGGELERWRRHLYRDLDARVLLRDRGFPDPALDWWERVPSPRVAALPDELQRRWLLWRDELVAAGVTAPGPLRAALVARQREWERAPHPEFAASPLRIAAEDDDSVAP